MSFEEKIFIIATTFTLILLAIFVKKIDWEKLGFKPKFALKGWWQILLFNAVIFTLVQLTLIYKFVNLPDLVIDKDPLIPLIIIGFLQEILFRGLLIHWLERWGTQKALWISTLIFVAFHLVAPYTWTSVGIIFAGLTLVGGYFWGWHFLKFRNIYMLGISHFLVNISFNYVVFSMLS